MTVNGDGRKPHERFQIVNGFRPDPPHRAERVGIRVIQEPRLQACFCFQAAFKAELGQFDDSSWLLSIAPINDATYVKPPKHPPEGGGRVCGGPTAKDSTNSGCNHRAVIQASLKNRIAYRCPHVGITGVTGRVKTGHVRARYTGHLRGEKIRHLAFSNPLLKESLDDETTHDGRSRYDPYTS